MHSLWALIVHPHSCLSGSSEPSDSASVGRFLPNPSLEDSANFESEGPGTDPPCSAFETQVNF